MLGPRIGARVQELKAALAAGSFEPDADGRVQVGDLTLEPGDYELRVRPREGFEAVDDGRFVVAIDTRITEELAREGLARDVVRHLQNVRKELGFEVSDRIVVQYATEDAELARTLAEHGETIAREVLAEQFSNGAVTRSPVPVGREPAGRVRRASRVTVAQARPTFRPEAVLFDCDGLLLETESRWTIAETGLLERHGGQYTPEFKKRLLGILARDARS